jgi:alpha,alpha-trehalase
MNRRRFFAGAAGTVLMSRSVLSFPNARAVDLPSNSPTLDESRWTALDAEIRKGWATNTSLATEPEIRADRNQQLLFLPFPYVSPTAPGSIYHFMFGWDTDFISRALIAQEAHDQVLSHILNYLFMIDRYGYMPNANAAALVTRSQTPLIADTTWRYYLKTKDRDLLRQAYPRLKRNYRSYWTASHHQTPTGLATNRDLGDPYLPPHLAAEAEVGLDWTPIFGGDVRRCVPIVTNCALVRYARSLANIAHVVGEAQEARLFAEDASSRAARLRQYCWNEEAGFFLEYDFVAEKQLPCRSDCALWALWAGVASPAQAKRLVGALHDIEQSFGLSCTDRAYPLPCPEKDYGPVCRLPPDGVANGQTRVADSIGGENPLQWMYPAGWAPSHLIAVEGLDDYGYTVEGTRVASKFLGLMMQQYERTGHLWEKYNVVDGSVVLPNARCGNIWMRGWTAAAAVLLGRRVFGRETLSPAA